MIVFDLKCACGFQFEGWFASSTVFEQQISDGEIHCPSCSGNIIKKILSPVKVQRSSSTRQVADNSSQGPAAMQESLIKYLHIMQEFVEKNFEDVGTDLATESLKIHYGVSKERNIRGVTTSEEDKMLHDEGIELLKIPMLKKKSDSEEN